MATFPSSPAARLLLIERDALLPILRAASASSFRLPTVCPGWSVRDVLAHCGAALTRAARGDLHDFSPAANQRDVDQRRTWTDEEVLAELESGYEEAASAIAAAEGRLDGIALGEWVHGGDVRDPLGEPDAYRSAGLDLALDLIAERSVVLDVPGLEVELPAARMLLGRAPPTGSLVTDPETLVRLIAGRRPDPQRYRLHGAQPSDLLLFT